RMPAKIVGIDAKSQLQSTNASRHEGFTGELNAEGVLRTFLFPALRFLRSLRLVRALNTTPELGRLTLHDRSDPILMWSRQLGQELRHPQVALLAQPHQSWLCGLKHRGGALHGEVQRLKTIDAEHVSRSAPVAVQPGDLERATPLRAGNRLWDSNRQH